MLRQCKESNTPMAADESSVPQATKLPILWPCQARQELLPASTATKYDRLSVLMARRAIPVQPLYSPSSNNLYQKQFSVT